MKRILGSTAIVLLAAAACSSSGSASGEDFRADFEAEMRDQISEAGLPEDLEELTNSTVTACLEETQPESAARTGRFMDCYAETLCSSELVTPVWEGDTAGCEEIARNSIDFG